MILRDVWLREPPKNNQILKVHMGHDVQNGGGVMRNGKHASDPSLNFVVFTHALRLFFHSVRADDLGDASRSLDDVETP